MFLPGDEETCLKDRVLGEGNIMWLFRDNQEEMPETPLKARLDMIKQ
jgi:hypothetical protein